MSEWLFNLIFHIVAPLLVIGVVSLVLTVVLEGP